MRTDYKQPPKARSNKLGQKQQLFGLTTVVTLAVGSFIAVTLLFSPTSNKDSVTSYSDLENIQIETIATPRPSRPVLQALEHRQSNLMGESETFLTKTEINTPISAEQENDFQPFPALDVPVEAPPAKVEISTEWPNASWKNVKVTRGDTAGKIFSELNLSHNDLVEIMGLGFSTKTLQMLYPGQILRFLIDEDGRLLQLIYSINTSKSLVIKRVGEAFEANIETRLLESKNTYANATIRTTLADAGQEANISDKLIAQLTSIYGWDIDFTRDLRTGDTFDIIYQDFYDNGKKVSSGNILAARFVNKGKVYDAIRFVSPEGDVGYFDPHGYSLQKSFLRSPVDDARISSRFTLARKHPVLHKMRAHKGVDYAAPTGTPIRATSSGTISYQGWRGGYGRAVTIKHDDKYSTLYGHMSRFTSKLKAGSKVKQGQIIGYVGSSGLASGPHVHYELRVNDKQIDPLTANLPKVVQIDNRYKKEFRKEAKRLIALLDASEAEILAAASTT